MNLSTHFRHWLLSSFGWKVVSVPLEDFVHLSDRSHNVRATYLSQRLRDAAPLVAAAGADRARSSKGGESKAP